MPDASRRMVFFGACLGMFMVSVEATIVATAIPTIVGDLGGLRLFSWVFGIYYLTQAVTIPIYGRLADVFGRKPLVIVAVTLFVAGSTLSGFAHDMIALIAFRGLQGLGAGGVQPVVSTIVGDLYTGQARLRVQGILSSVWGISALTGPLLGAFLIAHAGWPTIFWINVPFGVLLIGVMLRYLDENVAHHAHRIDVLGSALLAGGVGTLMFVLVMLGDFDPATTVVLVVFSLVLIGALIVHEMRTAEPMVPLGLLRIRVIAIANAGNIVLGAMSMAITAFLPTFVQGAMGLSAVLAGFGLGITSLMWTVGAIIGSRTFHPGNYRRSAMIGAAMTIVGSLILIPLAPESSIVQVFVACTFIGVGFGVVNLIFVISTQAAVEWQQRGAATASTMFSRQVGSSIGTAGFGAVFNVALYAAIPNAGNVVGRMIDPVKRAGLDAAAVHRDAAAIGSSFHWIYAIQCLLGIATLALVTAIPGKQAVTDV